MDELNLDPRLQQSLADIRESVRRLFEQLRLKGEEGDVPGKDRLERVPALSKRNFANLASNDSLTGIREAWRLVDFLEGAQAGQLSVHARAALRGAELDRKLGAFRESDQWRQAAERLRRALGADKTEHGEEKRTESTDRERTAREAVEAASVSRRGKTGRGSFFLAAGVVAVTALTAMAIWWRQASPDPRHACVALETASEEELRLHFSGASTTQAPQPGPGTAAETQTIVISDLPGGPVASTWTTSQFSYGEGMNGPGPGGGRSDFRLRIGGWGDTYVGLLMIPVPSNRLVRRAVLHLTVIGDAQEARPTPMTLRAVNDNWQRAVDRENRLWWRDCPQSNVIHNHLPPPGPRDTAYEIDITNLYNLWANGQQAPYGIMLEPEQIGSWRPGRPQYASFSTFYSTRARDPANRPRLILLY